MFCSSFIMEVHFNFALKSYSVAILEELLVVIKLG